MTPVPAPTEAQVLDDLRAVIREILQMEPDDDFAIEADASLTDELGLESIDLVNIGAGLSERYGEAVNLAVYLADQEIDDVIKLTVGALAEFVLDALAVAAASGASGASGASAASSAGE
jgi:acyl carrier protein